MDKISLGEIIRKLFQQDPSRRILGSKLAMLLRNDGYSSDLHGRLVDLISDHVPEVGRIERSGMDWSYGIVSRVEQTSLGHQEWNRDVWRA